MNANLNLKLDADTIRKAKSYANKQGQSLSRLVESYLKVLVATNKESEIEISPFVRDLCSGPSVSPDLDYKSEKSDSLTNKYN